MRNAVSTIVVLLLLCLALAPSVVLARTQPSSALSNVDDTRQSVFRVVVLASSNGMEHGHRRLLKSKPSKAKSKKRKTKWRSTSRGKITLLGIEIGVSVLVVAVLICVVILLITEKKEQDPTWRIRDLFKRRVKPGVKRVLTRRFTRKKSGDDDMENEKLPDFADPPKLQSAEV